MTGNYQTMRENISMRMIGLLCVLWFGIVDKCVAQLSALNDEPSFSRALYQTRQIGLRKDRARADILLARLQKDAREMIMAQATRIRLVRGMPWNADWSTHLYAATFVALGRLGELRATSEIESVIQDSAYSHLKPFALVALARIKAENAVPRPKTVAEWERKVQVFSRELGINLKEVTEVAETEKISWRYPPSLHRLALRALAEMAVEAYKGGARDAIEWCERAGIKWQSDVAASLTVQLAFFTEEERAKWLVQLLQSRDAFTPADSYLMQALADCGEKALIEVSKWLEAVFQERMQEERKTLYTRTDRILLIGFSILSGIGTRESQGMLQQYRDRVENEYLSNNIYRIIDQSPWTFTSDW